MAFDKILKTLFGSKEDRDMKELSPYVKTINKHYSTLQSLSDDELREKVVQHKKQLQKAVLDEYKQIADLKTKAENSPIDEREDIYNEIDKIEEDITEKLEKELNNIHAEVFAIVKETERRLSENKELRVTANDFDKDLAATKDFVTIEGDQAIYANRWQAGGTEIEWNMIPYDVQLIGGTVLHKGKIAEMATGEGKTLSSTLPIFLNALTGRGVHVVTVNDYLAKRDAEWNGPIFQFHGLSVDCIDKHRPNSEERRKAYNSDVTYGTNNEFGFDYLRDNMAINPEDMVQRKHNYAIIDEVDSVLIDDARTPLIISGPTPKGENQEFDEMKPRVERIVRAQNTLIRELFTKGKKLVASDNKKEREEGELLIFRVFKGAPKYKPLIKYLSEQGNKAQLLKTENFYMADNNRNMHIATDELFYVIDEKQNTIELTDKGLDLISKDDDDENFFILPDISTDLDSIEKNSEMSTQEKVEAKDAILQDYSTKAERVHTVNQLLKAYSLFERDVEYVVMDNKVMIVDEQTGRIMDGRRYSDGLHQAIEAKENVKIEAATQTYATVTLQNYFRMYNKLAGMTGTAETEAKELWDIYKLDVVVIPTNRPIARDDQNDIIYKTKREKYTAIIDKIEELVNAGRPVLVGTTSVEISELLSRMLKMKGIEHNVLNAKLHQKEADIVADAGRKAQVTIATNMAGRGTDIKLSDEVKAAGGLAIVGTERHESRRVDRQLRGRAGRQGDPGSSVFFVSLEDNLMRLFGSDRMIKWLDRAGLKEGEDIQAGMMTKQIEKAQRKVEENHFGVRKRLLEFDDVMNTQREAIYKKRRHALYGERLQVDVANTMYDVCADLVEKYHNTNSYESFSMDVLSDLAIECTITEDEYKSLNVSQLSDKLYDAVRDAYERKVEKIKEQAQPVINHVYEHKKETYQNIAVPITDGQKVYNIITNLEKAYESKGEELMRSYEKSVVLAHIDDAWKTHLRDLDDLKQSVQNASYEQKDPLVIYKFESFNLFKSMMNKVNSDIINTLMKGQIYLNTPDEVKRAEQKHTDYSKTQTQKESADGDGGSPEKEEQKLQPVRVAEKIGRNEPCPCGSGKKYKHCHGKN
ncbi:preprotein translocase subunit SecA [Balneicella halophila]|uniref:Protein translocase subunit SecA n=1 Tax=Balneicella halophila TaxID=1537566 RepID=A0A7L4URT6_BALHA|nr:preprotein translocase subunit SecA [Balneicella halophila]PVX52141.1 preprotein translocase subunit SecA [Balneicella halophila]